MRDRVLLAALRKEPATVVAAVGLAAYLCVAVGVVVAGWGEGYAETRFDPWAGMSSETWFGANRIGQDIFARTVRATGTAMIVGLSVAIPATVLGLLLGAVAAYYRGRWPDVFVRWCASVLDALPFYLLVIAFALALDGGLLAMQTALILSLWPTTARLVRAHLIGVAAQPFFAGARAIGASSWRLLFRHLTPHAGGIALAQFALTTVAAIKAESVLSFLGIGLDSGVSWGVMLAEATQEIALGETNNFFASAGALGGLILCLTILAERLQPMIDPRQVARHA